MEHPWRDDADDTDRLPRHGHVNAGAYTRHDLAGQAQAFSGEEIEDLSGAYRLAHPLGKRLPFLAGELSPQFLAPGEDLVRRLLEDVVALLDTRARPRRERFLGRCDCALRVRLFVPRTKRPALSSVLEGLMLLTASPSTHSPAIWLRVRRLFR